MASQFNRFKETLSELFMLDQAELDFGIYRIMNQKRTEINRYLDIDLVRQVKEVLAANAGGKRESLLKKIAEATKNAESLGVDVTTVSKIQTLKAELSELGGAEELENDVYDHLATFFKRYYDGGDFISLRRYKKDVYAIPYEGEEVKLHWANADQYYIKTSEYFRNYTFKLDGDKRVSFVLLEASTEQNNNKSQGDKERRFAIYAEKPVEIEGTELRINFTYEPTDKKEKQADLMAAAYETVKPLVPVEFSEVFSLRATDKNKNRTLLEKHFTDYVAKNTFDYFIHKDLRGFLTRELDFYIKNEILFIDDINTKQESEFLKYLSAIKAVKAVGAKIIDFLSSLEDFQKKLWLKKKFVAECNYCITLDRVPAELYAEIAANDAQREEWVRLFAIDEIKGAGASGLFADGATVGYSVPLSTEFLKSNPHLVLDTAFFDDRFCQRLVSSIHNLDEQLDGTLINSENFQALNLLQEKYKEQVKCIYIDPPFNLKQNGDFLYRTDYKDSTWATLVNDRMEISTKLLNKKGFFYLRCDNNGNYIARPILDNHFGMEKFLSELLVQRIRKNVTDQGRVSLPLANDSLFLYSMTESYEFINPYIKLQQERESYWRRIDDSSGYRNPPERNIFGKIFYPYKRDAHFKFSQDSINRMIEEGKIRIVCKECKKPHTTGIWKSCPDCGNTEATPQYLVSATDKKILDTNWLDIAGYSSKTGFSTENAEVLLDRVVELSTNQGDMVLDYFGGSGTTPAVSIQKNRKWICVEMGLQFYSFILPRLKKESSKKQGFFKYLSLEQYEDTLNNLVAKQTPQQTDVFNTSDTFRESFLLGYMLDTQTQDSLLSADWFVNPFAVSLNITRQNEMQRRKIDIIETFNYLIGLNIDSIAYPKDGICTVTGTTRRGEHSLIIWRDCTKIDNEALNKFFTKSAYSTRDNEFDRIYINGDNNLENLRTDEDHWKVVLTEEEFAKRMFEN